MIRWSFEHDFGQVFIQAQDTKNIQLYQELLLDEVIVQKMEKYRISKSCSYLVLKKCYCA